VDQDHLRDLFAGFGPFSMRRLFGGLGLYADGLIFACVIRDEIRIKVDEVTAPAFEAAGARPWVYVHKTGGKPVTMPYWSLPEAALDDPEAAAGWARLGLEAARRAAAAKPAPKKRSAEAALGEVTPAPLGSMQRGASGKRR